MSGKINTEKLRSEDIKQAVSLWREQFRRFCPVQALFSLWENNTTGIESHLQKTISAGNAIKAVQDGEMVGFIAFDIFDFHGSMSMMCHFWGNGAIAKNRKEIYLALYTASCNYCIKHGVLSHYIPLNANDKELIDMFFDLGFGAYVADAFAHYEQPCGSESELNICQAAVTETEQLGRLYAGSAAYFKAAPIHLKLPRCSLDEIAEKIRAGYVYIAKDGEKIIGAFSLRISENDDIYRFVPKGNCFICDGLGAYIAEEYRGRGIGSHFMHIFSEYCISNRIPVAHVDWETFNPYGNRFWRKYFTPTILAMKRTLHPDMLR